MNEEGVGESPVKPVVHPDQPQRQLTKAFWGFHKLYFRLYKRYAELQLGDSHLAGEITHQIFMQLRREWPLLMEEASPAATAWAWFKDTIANELDRQGLEVAMQENAAISRVARDLLDSMRTEFATMSTDLGLYQAIAQLPGRQFDVMVLMYVLGYSMDKTAHTMGVSEATVRSNRDRARHRIERYLSHYKPDADH